MWNFMAAQGTEIDKKLLMKIYVIAFMVMKDGKRFLTFLKPLIRQNHQFQKQTFYIGTLPSVFTIFVCIHRTCKLVWTSGFKYVPKRMISAAKAGDVELKGKMDQN